MDFRKAIIVLFALCLFNAGISVASGTVEFDRVPFTIGMEQTEALAKAEIALSVITVSGVNRVFLYRRNSGGQPIGNALGALDFENSRLVHIRRDIGTLESKDAVQLGRALASSISESGGTASQPDPVKQITKSYSTGIRSIVLIHLKDRIVRLQAWETSASGTTSSFEVTEHFGDFSHAN